MRYAWVLLFASLCSGQDSRYERLMKDILVEQVRQGATIFLTSHVLEVVERLCDRVAIIDHGSIIASGTHADLVRQSFGSQCELVLHFDGYPAATHAEWAAARGGTMNGASVRFTVTDPAVEIAQILESARSESIPIRDLSFKTPNLESVFLHLTGRGLRE